MYTYFFCSSLSLLQTSTRQNLFWRVCCASASTWTPFSCRDARCNRCEYQEWPPCLSSYTSFSLGGQPSSPFCFSFVFYRCVEGLVQEEQTSVVKSELTSQVSKTKESLHLRNHELPSLLSGHHETYRPMQIWFRLHVADRFRFEPSSVVLSSARILVDFDEGRPIATSRTTVIQHSF